MLMLNCGELSSAGVRTRGNHVWHVWLAPRLPATATITADKMVELPAYAVCVRHQELPRMSRGIVIFFGSILFWSARTTLESPRFLKRWTLPSGQTA